MLNSPDLKSLCTNISAIALAAGEAIMAVYNREFSVELKDDRSPLTEADKAAHSVIVERLRALTPDLPILSEESSQQDIADRLQWPTYWLVDPLDGTKEFIKRNGEFTVNIALVDQHEAQMGVVYAPAIETLYTGINGVGAWKQIGDKTEDPISVTQMASEPLRVVGSRSHPSPALADYLQWLGPHEITPMGSSLKICLVAAGDADVYPRLGPTSEWDTAAAHAVLLAAGGSMMDPNGDPLRYNKGDSLLNPHFFAFGDLRRQFIP